MNSLDFVSVMIVSFFLGFYLGIPGLVLSAIIGGLVGYYQPFGRHGR